MKVHLIEVSVPYLDISGEICWNMNRYVIMGMEDDLAVLKLLEARFSPLSADLLEAFKKNEEEHGPSHTPPQSEGKKHCDVAITELTPADGLIHVDRCIEGLYFQRRDDLRTYRF